MTRRLRQRHRYVFILLAALLPVGIVLGLTGRKVVPTTAGLPASLTRQTGPLQEIWKRPSLFPERNIAVRLLHSAEGDGLAIELTGNLSAPDLLVYWSSMASTGDLPPDVVLLGRFGQSVAAPRNVVGRNGHLVLYSLANHEVVATSQGFELSARN